MTGDKRHRSSSGRTNTKAEHVELAIRTYCPHIQCDSSTSIYKVLATRSLILSHRRLREPLAPDQAGYTIDEIRDISREFFGTISTELGSVIEYAFSSAGRPDGYVLGTEGGGAFLAGVRYGSGKLYLHTGGSEKVSWHGPSIGYDFGGEGSRTMFLIYHLGGAPALYRTFTGIDGSAYFIGGVGITFLKGGPVLMAPIRIGLGLRLGANIGYIRFTPRATWNPF